MQIILSSLERVKGPHSEKMPLRKGAWSPEEDQKLIAYINRYRIWNWSQMARPAGRKRVKFQFQSIQKLIDELSKSFCSSSSGAYIYVRTCEWYSITFSLFISFQVWKGLGRVVDYGG